MKDAWTLMLIPDNDTKRILKRHTTKIMQDGDFLIGRIDVNKTKTIYAK